MAEDSVGLLAMLQHADSMFPSGAVSFSFGLETLVNRGIVAGCRDLEAFLTAQLRGRWADLDRPILWHAHHTGDDLAALACLDALVNAQSLSVEQRLGSTRMGQALLGVHQKLGTPLAGAYAEMITRDSGFGHLPVVQGLLWRALGISANEMLVMSAHSVLTSMLGAAIRLSVVGYIQAQRIHAALLPVIAEILETPICAPEETHAFVPQIDIASMLHETDDVRLFVN